MRPESIENLRQAIRNFRPDVVCVDPIATYGVVAAEKRGGSVGDSDSFLASVADPSWPCPWMDAMRELEPMVLENMKHYGISSVSLRAGNAISPVVERAVHSESPGAEIFLEFFQILATSAPPSLLGRGAMKSNFRGSG